MITVTHDPPWLQARLPETMICLSWAPYGGGWMWTDRVIWRQVRNTDLPQDIDATAWLETEMTQRKAGRGVAMLTARHLARVERETAGSGSATTEVLATVGLSNAERVGTRTATPHATGTINILAVTRAQLTEAAQIEALSIVTQARTAAIMDTGLTLPTGRATGTGTDCIVLASLRGTVAFAGLHTAIGEALGAATYAAVRRGAATWLAETKAQ